MSVNCYILSERRNHTFLGIYCHNCGNITYTGALLLDYYQQREKVNFLFCFGNLSLLGINVEPYPFLEHSFDNPQKGVCVFYGRDNREEDQNAKIVTLDEVDNPSFYDYVYIYTLKGEWKYFVCGRREEMGLYSLKKGLEEEYQALGIKRRENEYTIWYPDTLEARKREDDKQEG